jgi:hypothetical protein
MDLISVVLVIHVILVVLIYFRDPFYGIHSVYALSIILVIFVPLVYNALLFKEYQSTLGIHLSLLTGTILVSIVKTKYVDLLLLLKGVLIAKRVMNVIFLISMAFTIMIFALGFLGNGYFLRFPTIGFFSMAILMMFYSFHFRELYGHKYLAFFVLALLQFLGFFFLLWTGFGRLLLFQFFTITVFFGSFYVKKVQLLKTLIILTIPLMVGIGGALRQEEGSIRGVIETGQGMGSIFVPLKYTELIFADITNEKIEPLQGSSFLASVLFFVPRQFWPEKPVGFGKTMVAWYMPNYYFSEHSLAGLYLGEVIGNFGVNGLWLSPLLLLFVFQIVSTIPQKRDSDYMGFLRIILFAIFLAGISDFVWGGTFVYFSRAAIAAGSLLLTFWLISRK